MRKRGYDSKADAKRAARLTESSGKGHKVGRMNVYRCDGFRCTPDCRLWHIGHGQDHRIREAS